MKIKLILCAMLFSLLGFSQESFDGKIQWSESFKLKSNENDQQLIGTIKNELYSIRRIKDDRSIITYDLSSLTVLNESPIKLEYNDFKLSIVNSFIFGDNIVLLTKYTVRKSNELHFLLNTLNKDGSFEKTIELASVEAEKDKVITTKKGVEKKKKTAAYSFRCILSPDKKSVIVYYIDDDEPKQTTALLIDSNLSILNQKTFELPFDNFHVYSTKISNNGLIYYFGIEYKIIDDKKKEFKEHHILVYDVVKGTVKSTQLDFDKSVRGAAMQFMENNELIVSGLHNEKEQKGISGSFFMKLKSDLSIDFLTIKDFSANFIEQYWNDNDEEQSAKSKNENDEPAFFDYKIQDLLIKDNGDILMLAEQYYMDVFTSTYTDNSGATKITYTYTYNYNDVIVVSCNSTGHINWMKVIPKYQYSVNDKGKYSSFFTTLRNNEVLLFYNDKESNMDHSEELNSKQLRKAKKNQVSAYISISDNGEIKRKVMYTFIEDETGVIIPKGCELLYNGDILLYSSGGYEKICLGILKF